MNRPAIILPSFRSLLIRRSNLPSYQRRAKSYRSVSTLIIVVIVGHIVVNCLLESYCIRWRDPEFGLRSQLLSQYVNNNPGKHVVVILGSSRTQMGINPDDFGSTEHLVMNCSQAGCGPIHELLNLHRLLRSGLRPARLIVEVLPPVLAGDGPVEDLIPGHRLSYDDCRFLARYCQDSSRLLDRWYQSRMNPLFQYRSVIMSLIAGRWLPWQHRQDYLWKQTMANGWMPYFHTTVSDEHRQSKTAEARLQYQDYFRNYQIAPLADRAYRDLLVTAQRYDIQIAFIIMPESREFQSAYPNHAWDSCMTYLNKLSSEFQVPILNYRDCLSSDDFADGHHPLQSGSKKIGSLLKTDFAKWVRDTP